MACNLALSISVGYFNIFEKVDTYFIHSMGNDQPKVLPLLSKPTAPIFFSPCEVLVGGSTTSLWDFCNFRHSGRILVLPSRDGAALLFRHRWTLGMWKRSLLMSLWLLQCCGNEAEGVERLGVGFVMNFTVVTAGIHAFM